MQSVPIDLPRSSARDQAPIPATETHLGVEHEPVILQKPALPLLKMRRGACRLHQELPVQVYYRWILVSHACQENFGAIFRETNISAFSDAKSQDGL